MSDAPSAEPDSRERSLLEIAEALAGAHGAGELHEAIDRVAEALGATSAALLGAGADPATIHVLAASDDAEIGGLALSLSKYPEVRGVLESGQPSLVTDVGTSDQTAGCRRLLEERGIRSLLSFPILVDRKPVGALLARFADPRVEFAPEVLAFGRMATALIAVAIRAGRLLDPLRELTRRVTFQDANEGSRVRAIERYRDFIDSAADGIVVLDAEGRVLYMNHAAESLTGYARGGLAGHRLLNIVAEAHRPALVAHIEQAVKAERVANFDLDLVTTSGDKMTVSVASIGVLSEHMAAVFAFRDVTLARQLERELRRTKEFLERIINSTVDAIIAADMKGNVLVFNQGAERILGLRFADIAGKMSVREIYPVGVAEEVMHLLRSSEHGGPGRLEPIRRDLKNVAGETVPVTLSAAIVFDDQGQEIATVGIFSDLRERLRMEERLASAQERLALSQKQAVAVELAGAAAHELNQPLTSVMGYAEMLKKKLGKESPHARLVDTIAQEAERMAGIVRQLGSLTRYETKSYVGGAQIIDLDRSAQSGKGTEE